MAASTREVDFVRREASSEGFNGSDSLRSLTVSTCRSLRNLSAYPTCELLIYRPCLRVPMPPPSNLHHLRRELHGWIKRLLTRCNDDSLPGGNVPQDGPHVPLHLGIDSSTELIDEQVCGISYKRENLQISFHEEGLAKQTHHGDSKGKLPLVPSG